MSPLSRHQIKPFSNFFWIIFHSIMQFHIPHIHIFICEPIYVFLFM